MNKYDTSNYNCCCINNTIAVWNLTPPPVNIALIPQQHVKHPASKYQVDITDIDNNTWYVYNVITTRLLIILCNNIVFTITTALYAGSVYHLTLISCLHQYNTYQVPFMRVI